MWCFWEFLFLWNHYVTLASWFLTLAFLLGLVFVFLNECVFLLTVKQCFCSVLTRLTLFHVFSFFVAFFFVFLKALVPFLILLP